MCSRNITAFNVISIVLSCLTIYLLLGTYIYYFTMTKYVVQLVYLLILAIITWHWNGDYMFDPGDSSRANQENNSWERFLRGKTPLWCHGKDNLRNPRFGCTSSCAILSYLRYLWLLAHSGVQDIFCCVMLCFSSSFLCCQFLWIVNFWVPLPYSLTCI